MSILHVCASVNGIEWNGVCVCMHACVCLFVCLCVHNTFCCITILFCLWLSFQFLLQYAITVFLIAVLELTIGIYFYTHLAEIVSELNS